MKRIVWLGAVALLVLTVPSAAEVEFEQAAAGAVFGFQNGCLASLRSADGEVYVRPRAEGEALTLQRLDGAHTAAYDGEAKDGAHRYALTEEAKTELRLRCAPTEDGIAVRHAVTSSKPGVWGVEWVVSEIPLEMNILVPAISGMKLSQDSPGQSWQFDYPFVWTNQIVVVEGRQGGFSVWAEDTDSIFKRVAIERSETGWTLRFTTMPFAPFDDKTTVPEVIWNVSPYTGDWRVAAKHYRDWATEVMAPVPVEAQTPSWVKDTRNCVIMGTDLDMLELLAERLDPLQTIIYIPSWRAAGYDRNYPEYDRYLPKVRPFIERAHALGFRIMLHVNYFGVDPLHPLYEQFEPYQVRNPFGDHDKEWWLWEKADPVIKFAYINPACAAWRDEFVSRMVALRDDLQVDALHLDQTLCIYNDHNGLIDGMTMPEGAVALHRQLREALPEVAISGEGLNEITMRHEAFAQRHAYGLSHHEGTYHVARLRMAHPIASYLMRPFTVMYGYLGCAPPTQADMYNAWDEANRYWGIIPTLKPNRAALASPTGFTRQFLDEANFYTRERVDPDLDGAWPPGVAFPYRTARGDVVRDMADGRLLYGDEVVSRTLYGVSTAELPGTISGWRAYNKNALIGLEPTQWYPYFEEPRDYTALHLESVPDGFTVGAIAETPSLAYVRTRAAKNLDLWFARMLDGAQCGTRRDDGGGERVHGVLYGAEDGAHFQPNDDDISAHPPWKTGVSGEVYARFELDLPKSATRFTSEVGLADRALAEDKSDGATFRVRVTADGDEAVSEVHHAEDAPAPFNMDLRAYAGKHVTIELAVDPGPERSPSFDWARWYDPRVECDPHTTAEMRLGGVSGWRHALGKDGLVPLSSEEETVNLRTDFPGAAYLLAEAPERVALPLRLTSMEPVVTIASDAGTVLKQADYAEVRAVTATAGGVSREAFFAHPPSFGRTQADFAVTLPEGVKDFHGYVGLRDGSVDGDVDFVVEVNGTEAGRLHVTPGGWHEMTCPLTTWAGKPVVISLATDSNGTHSYDWAHWGEPTLR